MEQTEKLQDSYTKVLEKISTTYADLNKPFQPKAPRLIAVSKGQPLEKVVVLYGLGQRDFGENYAQELKTKADQARAAGLSEIRWHFIGNFQSNKLGLIEPFCPYVHSVESFSHLDLFRRKSPQTKLFLAVNIDDEKTKSGFSPEELRQGRDNLALREKDDVVGLMCIPDPARDSRPSFARLRKLAEEIFAGSPYELSMGMSGDYTVAIKEGSSWVRVGTALFGERAG